MSPFAGVANEMYKTDIKTWEKRQKETESKSLSNSISMKGWETSTAVDNRSTSKLIPQLDLLVGWLVFYSMSTFMGYLMQNYIYMYIFVSE